MSDYPLSETPYGFMWGPATVTRMLSDPQAGVVIHVLGRGECVIIRVTPSGRLRISHDPRVIK